MEINPDPIRIVVVDDHPLYLQGVINTLMLEKEFLIVGQASTGSAALELIRKTLPKVAIIDINLPGLNGQQVAQHVSAEKLPTRIILLTAYDDAEQKVHAINSGAYAYCTKEILPDELTWIVKRVAEGNYVIGNQEYDPSYMETWLKKQSHETVPIGYDPGEVRLSLSSREMEVLTYVANGLSNKEIAMMLGISRQTVKNHITAILRKLGVGDRTQAALYALRLGWVRQYQSNNVPEE